MGMIPFLRQVQVKTAVSPRHIVIDIYREYGIRGFYRGYVSSFLAHVLSFLSFSVVIGSLTWTPLSAIWFMTYERLKPLNFGRDELARDGSVSAAWLALSGFIAGVVACELMTFFPFPLNVSLQVPRLPQSMWSRHSTKWLGEGLHHHHQASSRRVDPRAFAT